MQHVGHTYTKKSCVIYLKFKFNWVCYVFALSLMAEKLPFSFSLVQIRIWSRVTRKLTSLQIFGLTLEDCMTQRTGREETE
jgi:hypothetical protein